MAARRARDATPREDWNADLPKVRQPSHCAVDDEATELPRFCQRRERRARRVHPRQYAPVTDEMLRNPLGVIPSDQRPRVALRYSAQNDLLVSGW